MADPSTAPELSMEEILASIREIMSEQDQEAAVAPAPDQAAIATTALQDGFEPAVSVEAETHLIPPSRAKAQPFEAMTPASPMARSRLERSAIAADARGAMSDFAHSEDQALSPESGDIAVSGAVGALARAILAQNPRPLDEIVSETLRPMLKDWLDDNLPGLVERLVKQEIEQVSRGRR